MTAPAPGRPRRSSRPRLDLTVHTFPGWGGLARRSPRLLVGVAMLGVGIGLMVRAHLGLSPWDVLHSGIAAHTGLDFGTVVIIVGAGVLLLWFPLRQRPGIATVVNTLCVGLVADLTIDAVPAVHGIGVRAGLLAAGVVVVGVGTGCYLSAGLGPGPRDGLMTALAARRPPLWAVRTAIELSALAVGRALGGDVGIGTVVFALAIGPLAHVSLSWLRFPDGPVRTPGPDLGPGVTGE